MRFARSLMLAVLTIATLGVIPPGCKIFNPAPIAAGQDPVAVNAERTHKSAVAAIDAFLNVDNDNRAMMRAKFPTVHAFAEQLRTDAGKAVITESWDAIRAYEAAAAPGAYDTMEGKLAALETFARQARAFLVTIRTGAPEASTTQPAAGAGAPPPPLAPEAADPALR